MEDAQRFARLGVRRIALGGTPPSVRWLSAAPRAMGRETGLDTGRVPAAGREAERLLGRALGSRVPRMGEA